MPQTHIEVGDDGERVVPDIKDWNFYSHLSVYHHASRYTKSRRVLDAGCGTGYGTAYLAENGATEIVGLDLSAKAIEYCRAHYVRDGLRFDVADLCATFPVKDKFFDVIVSSQAMEHLADIENFFQECRRVLRPLGLMVFAVPAITSRQQLEENIWNKYHITNLTPLGWYRKARRNFWRVTSFCHWPKTSMSWAEIHKDLKLPPQETNIRETDFAYSRMEISSLNVHPETLNTVLVCRFPRRRLLARHVEEHIPHAWGEGALHARIRHEETELLRWKLWQATSGGPARD